MTPRPDVREIRKKQILEAAARVFSTRGIVQARMDDIVAESGLSKGTLYWYFKGKDDIIVGIVEHLIQTELDQLSEVAAEGPSTARESLSLLVEVTVRDLQRIEEMMSVSYEFLALASRRPDVQAVFTEFFRRYLVIISPIVQKGIESGEFREVDAADAARTLAALVEGTILLKLYDPEKVDLETQLWVGFEIYMEGLGKPA